MTDVRKSIIGYTNFLSSRLIDSYNRTYPKQGIKLRITEPQTERPTIDISDNVKWRKSAVFIPKNDPDSFFEVDPYFICIPLPKNKANNKDRWPLQSQFPPWKDGLF
jgi:hypothetical protein